MDIKKAYELTTQAVSNGELSKLLLGDPKYRYIPKYSTAYITDLATLIPCGLYAYERQHPDIGFALTLYDSLISMLDSYEGLVPVASYILVECYERTLGRSPFYFDLKPLSQKLSGAIARHYRELSNDITGPGKVWPDGLLGELRNINDNTVELGGPPFFP